jgi:hypothetical protein
MKLKNNRLLRMKKKYADGTVWCALWPYTVVYSTYGTLNKVLDCSTSQMKLCSHCASSSSNLAWFQSSKALVTCLLNASTIFTDACSSWTRYCTAAARSRTFSPRTILSSLSVGGVPQDFKSRYSRYIGLWMTNQT